MACNRESNPASVESNLILGQAYLNAVCDVNGNCNLFRKRVRRLIKWKKALQTWHGFEHVPALLFDYNGIHALQTIPSVYGVTVYPGSFYDPHTSSEDTL